jgi:hypothetical protein
MKKLIASALLVSMLAGCAGTGAKFSPMVDGVGDAQQYRRDLSDCQDYADRLSSAGEAAAVGAVAGAGLGILLAVISGGRGDGFRKAMVGAGAIGGAAGAAGRAENEQRSVISKCLAGRGYSVLQ